MAKNAEGTEHPVKPWFFNAHDHMSWQQEGVLLHSHPRLLYTRVDFEMQMPPKTTCMAVGGGGDSAAQYNQVIYENRDGVRAADIIDEDGYGLAETVVSEGKRVGCLTTTAPVLLGRELPPGRTSGGPANPGFKKILVLAASYSTQATTATKIATKDSYPVVAAEGQCYDDDSYFIFLRIPLNIKTVLLSLGILLAVWTYFIFWLGGAFGYQLQKSKRTQRSRTVMTQAQTTYRQDLATPRFQPLPTHSEGAWPVD